MQVYKAIASVMGDLAKTGIAKDQTNTFDKYKFRGIDAVYNALAPLLAKHGLVILPRVLERHSEERASNNGNALFYITVKAEFDMVSSEDGSKHTLCAYGEAMDRGDKATNKAMTAAYKYAMFEAFCIPTEGSEDADNESHTVQAKTPDETDNSQAAQQYRAARCAEYAEANSESIQAIHDGIASGDFVKAAEAWFELDQDTMRALWVAPSKGGVFSTKEREVMRSDEFTKHRPTKE